MTDLTVANAVIALTVPGVFNAPFVLEGFAADDIFNTPSIEAGEGSMGVDGKYSAGFVFKEVPQEYKMQADSPSMVLFDQWYAYEQANRTKIAVDGSTTLTGLGTTWVMTRGFLIGYTPIVSGGRTAKPRTFAVNWNLVVSQPA